MKRFTNLASVYLAGLTFAVGMASAQSTVTLPDESETTTLTASVSEQAKVTVPSNVTFNVDDISISTVASAASVTIENIVLETSSKQLKASIQANAAAFTPPVVSAATWSAGDVTWNAGSWTSAVAASGTLSDSAYGEVATCTADTATCSTSALVFTLAPNTSVKRSGNHTLDITWKFEAIGT